jgi:uncharacterized small protein (TIGR04563 family)
MTNSVRHERCFGKRGAVPRYRNPDAAHRQRATGPRLGYYVGMSESDKRKQSLYFPDEMLKEISTEAMRQDRSLSWIVQKAWKAARKDIMGIPSMGEPARPDSDK